MGTVTEQHLLTLLSMANADPDGWGLGGPVDRSKALKPSERQVRILELTESIPRHQAELERLKNECPHVHDDWTSAIEESDRMIPVRKCHICDRLQ